MTNEECFAHLNLKVGASEVEVKKAYKKMALKFHPDKNPSDPEGAKAQFLKIGEAYKRITDPDSFKDEDGEGEPSEEEMSAMFNMMFSEMMGGMGFGGGGGMPGGMGGMRDMMEAMMGEEIDSDDEDLMPPFGMGMAGMPAGGGRGEMEEIPMEFIMQMMGGQGGAAGGPMGGGGDLEEMLGAAMGGGMPGGGSGGGMGDMMKMMEAMGMSKSKIERSIYLYC